MEFSFVRDPGRPFADVGPEAAPLTWQLAGAAPWLGGVQAVGFPLSGGTVWERGGWRGRRAQDWSWGVAEVPFEGDLSTVTQTLYRELFAALAEHHPYRVWHFVPAINAVREGEEVYKTFCRGRAEAFARVYGSAASSRMPAASAVGSQADTLAVACIAGAAVPEHLENPRQVPAYQYPRQYGSPPPSFARATRVGRSLFVSGTSAVAGHASVAEGDLGGQLEATAENLEVLARHMGWPAWPAAPGPQGRHWQVYLRHPEHLGAAQAFVAARLAHPQDSVTYLHADLCRAELLVEIEVTALQTSASGG